MMPSPLIPAFWARSSSGRELQSAPKPSSRRIFRMWGLGQALTAKYSRKPGAQAKARSSARAVSRMAFSS